MLKSFLSGIRGKLLVLAILPIVCSALGTYLTFSRADRMSSSINDLTTNVIPSVQSLGEVRKARYAATQFLWSAIVHAADDSKRKDYIHKATIEFKDLLDNMAVYEKTPMDDFESTEFPKIKTALPEYVSSFKKIAELIDAGGPENIAAATALMDQRYLEIGMAVSEYCEKVYASYEETADAESTKTSAAHSELKSANIWTSIISSLILFLITFVVSEKIARDIAKIAEDLKQTGRNVRESIDQLSSAGSNLSQTSTSVAASLEETVASLEELSAMVSTNSQNARKAASMSEESFKSAEAGQKEISKLISSMSEISQSSKKIEEIINVIDDIAFQTNLLALNAAVEAARAGEQGKGFAVVAEAVRSLALRSSSAAKDIADLISHSVSQIDDGVKVADQSGLVLANIVSSVKTVSDLNVEISEASTQQAAGLTQINQAMSDLDQSSQTNAASAQQIASTSTEIAGQAEEVESEVTTLNAYVLGARRAS